MSEDYIIVEEAKESKEMIPDIEFKVLDLRDEEVEKAFLEHIRKMGI